MYAVSWERVSLSATEDVQRDQLVPVSVKILLEHQYWLNMLLLTSFRNFSQVVFSEIVRESTNEYNWISNRTTISNVKHLVENLKEPRILFQVKDTFLWVKYLSSIALRKKKGLVHPFQIFIFFLLGLNTVNDPSIRWQILWNKQ